MKFKIWDRVKVKDFGVYKMGMKGIIVGLIHFNDKFTGPPDLAVLRLDHTKHLFKAMVCNLKKIN